nr:immunoglobulin light chain junction region [Macaca mulatta]
CMQTQQNPLTF